MGKKTGYSIHHWTVFLFAFWLILQACSSVGYFGQISFISIDENNFQQVFIASDGQKATQITYDSSDKCCIAWSPDGERVAFGSHQSEEENQSSIQIMEMESRIITDQITVKGLIAEIAWSPDGERLAFTYFQDSAESIAHMQVLNINTLESSNLLTINGRMGHISWSPTSDQFAFCASINNTFTTIYIIDADGSDLTQMTNLNLDNLETTGMDHDPAWSPDGSAILFSSNRGFGSGRTAYDNFDIYLIYIKEKNIVQITNTEGIEDNPVWSPDGKEIVYTNNPSGNYEDPKNTFEIWVMNADGTGQHPILKGESNFYTPSWSSDGKHITAEKCTEISFIELYPMGFSCNSSVVVLSVDGSFTTEFKGFDVNYYPRWRP
jgi:TolB protein